MASTADGLRLLRVPRVVAGPVADGEVLDVAVAAVDQRLDVFQRRVGQFHRFTADPARHDAVQLAGDGAVDLDAGEGQAAHGRWRLDRWNGKVQDRSSQGRPGAGSTGVYSTSLSAGSSLAWKLAWSR